MAKRLARGLVVAGITFVTSAWAAKWDVVYEGRDRQDPKCTVRLMIDSASGWDRMALDPSHAACPHEDAQDIRSLARYDCPNRMSCLLSLHTTTWAGKISQSDFEDDGSHCARVVPDTYGEMFFERHCP